MIEEAEVVDAEGQELEPYRGEVAPSNLFGVSDPVDVIEKAEKVASALKGVLEQQGMIQRLGNNDHVKVDGWTLLGSMLGVFPVPVWTRKLEDGWEARVEARTRSGEVVGAGDAMCTRSEANWKNRDDYALRSMAQTRATSKALKVPLGFVITLAGYNATPAEEIPGPVETSGRASAGPGMKMASKEKMQKIAKLIAKLEASQPTAESGGESWADAMRAHVGGKHGEKMTVEEAEMAIEFLEKADVPFG